MTKAVFNFNLFKMANFKLIYFLVMAIFGRVAALPVIQQNLWDQLSIRGSANVLLSFHQDSTLLSRISSSFDQATSNDRALKISSIKSALEEEASLSQTRVISHLLTSSNAKVSYSSLWISNQIYIRNVDEVLLKELLQFEEITKISLERILSTFNPVIGKDDILASSPKEGGRAEWGVGKIMAEAALERLRNVTGNNIPEIRVGVMSTGAHVTHEVLRDSFLGDYGWFDPAGFLTPVDEVGVGSHETGVIAGGLGVGVFPLAKWMSCRACESFGCDEFAVLSCAEFMTCPFNSNDTAPDCSKAPHVVHGDIWTLPGDTWFDKPLEVWEAAGIIPVWPVGGQGPVCGTVRYPSESGKVIAVGGTTPDDIWYERSSAGPANGRIKPEMVAPATNVMSAFNLDDTTLVPLSATSCGSAHTAGVVALLKGYDPNLTFTQVLIALARGAQREGLETGVDDEECGGVSTATWPNNVFGFGRLNALASLNYVIQHF